MSAEDTARELIKGGYDLHIHSSPDIMPRKGNDLEFARRAAAAGMAGILTKSHYVPTADRATLVNEIVPGTRVYGSLTLNHAMGALNPIAVDVAGRSGARLIWFPTVDAANEVAYQVNNPTGKRAYWFTIQQKLVEQGMSRPPFSILGESGKLVPHAIQVLEVIASYDMILATGHLGNGEIVELVKAARGLGVRRIVLTHPEFPSQATPVDLQVELARQGVFMERCYTTPYSGKISWEEIFAATRTVGPEMSILATDLGQPTAPWPDEGLADFARRYLEAGFTEDEVRKMVVDNPASLVNL
jgi:hypothetical protein